MLHTRFLHFLSLLLFLGLSYAKERVVLISLDGFRYNYLKIAKEKGYNISAFQSIIDTGLHPDHVKNEFPTNTFPNHYSIVTGKHIESHGLVDNKFYDPRFKDIFNFKDDFKSVESKWFEKDNEPLWITNQRHAHRSAVLYWVGGLAPIRGQLPYTSFGAFNSRISLKYKLNVVKQWLESQHYSLMLMYHSEPDHYGHVYGPGKKVLEEITDINNDLAVFLHDIKKYKDVNLVIVSDHGMANSDPKKFISIKPKDLFNAELCYLTTCMVRPLPGVDVQTVYKKLKSEYGKNINVYLRDEMPEELHYSKHYRIAPIIMWPKYGYAMVFNDSKKVPKGLHGYDPKYKDMNPILMASGPGIKKLKDGQQPSEFHLVDIYPMVCWLLGLDKPWPHNGSLARVAPYLTHPPSASELASFELYANGTKTPPSLREMSEARRSSTMTIFIASFVVMICLVSGFILLLFGYRRCRNVPRRSSSVFLRRRRNKGSAAMSSTDPGSRFSSQTKMQKEQRNALLVASDEEGGEEGEDDLFDRTSDIDARGQPMDYKQFVSMLHAQIRPQSSSKQ